MQHNIRDPNRDHQHGRIFRLTVKDRPLQKPVKIHGQSIAGLLENLKHPVNGVRHRSRIELSTHDSDKVIAATLQWAKDFNPNDETEAHHLLEALWVHQQHGVQNDELLNRLMYSSVDNAVVAAKTVHHFWHNFDAKRASEFAAPAASNEMKYDTPKHLTGADKKIYKLGSKIYQREAHCATCHLQHGKGSPNVYPPLAGSPWVTGSEDRLIKMALHGVWGKMTVNGKTYDPARGVPPMTAFKNLLNDDELAAVLTFVRNTWGNQASTISPDAVKRVRQESSGRSTFWKPEELLAEHPLEAGHVEAVEEFSNEALEAELLATSSSELAKIAMESGEFKQGKKLFFESAAACYACHAPPKGAVRLGPDLERLKTKLTPEQLVDSLLRPSKLIDKAYAQVNVIDVNGTVQTGIRVTENDEQIVLQNPVSPKPIIIKQDNIEDVIESKVSLMPANLVRQLKNRKEFDDLMRYVLETRKR